MQGSDLDLISDAARHSGEIALRHWGKSPEVWEKSGNAGPVTEADLAIDRMLSAELLSARPTYGWLSEETQDDRARLGSDRQFIVDPIDGTRAFIAGEKTFSHSIAVACDGRICAGAVFLPALDLMFTAEADKAACLNGVPITATDVPIDGASVLSARAGFNPDHWRNAEVPPIKRSFRTSLAYRLCLVAQGRFDAMLTLRNTWEWDVAAGSLIAQAAGATVTDAAGRTPRFNNHDPHLAGMLAAGPTVHSALVNQLKPR